MRRRATPEEIVSILARAGGCEASQKCPPKSCVCRAQAAMLHAGWSVFKQAAPKTNTQNLYSSDDIANIIKLYHQGTSYRLIADAINRTTKSVRWKIQSLIKSERIKSRRKIYLPGTEMTKRQKDVLDFIQAFWKEHGYAPSYDAIKDGVGLASKSHISRIIIALEERGFITRAPRKARSIRVVPQSM